MDVEKGASDEEKKAFLADENEGRQDAEDGEHLNQADDIELDDFTKAGPSFSNIAHVDVNAEESNELEESNISEGTNELKGRNESEKSKDEIEELWDKNSDLNFKMNVEESNELEDSNISEGTHESGEYKDEMEKLWDKNSRLLNAIAMHNNKNVIRLLNIGANPNATCRISLKSACHIAMASSNEKALRILLEAGAKRKRFDRVGNTPLHYAAWKNAPRNMALILDFQEGLTNEETKLNRTLTSKQEAEIKKKRACINSLLNATMTIMAATLPDEWMTSYGYRDYSDCPVLMPGCSALHAASEAAYPQCVRILLEAGANPNPRDASNSTPLDVAGAFSSKKYVQSYEETLQLLREYGGRLNRHESRVLERALDKGSLRALKLLLKAGAPINHRNKEGFTPMHLCVTFKFKEHLEVLANYRSPEMDYRAVDVTDKDGSTVLHWAARECWADGVTVALLAKADIIRENSLGDTALHLAAKAGDYKIVKQILNHDTNRKCDFSKENVKGENPFSNAICSGNVDIVRLMIQLNKDMRGYLKRSIGVVTPLAYAAENKFQKLFFFILKEIIKGKDLSVLANPLHDVFIRDKHWELLSELQSLKNDAITYYMKNEISRYHILHEATTHSKREQIIDLLEFGADLSQRNEDGQTAISLLMYHVTKPTEFLTKLLDGCIKTDKNIYQEDCVITINYSLLKPENKKPRKPEYEESEDDFDHLNTKEKDMKVLEALIETGNADDQRSLLTHPVIESFLYLKWKKCAKFIKFLISVYLLFLISFNIFIGTIYYHMDHKIMEQDILFVFNPIFWRVSAIITLCLSSLVDFIFWMSSKKKWYRNKTIGVKLLLTVGGITMLSITMDTANNDILRGVAVVSVCLSWIYLMIYLSWTPTLGYYMQMYGKVSWNLIKVMMSFCFPLVGFCICFMILLRSKEPFDDPIAAFLRTMVMMSSEFDYENLMKNARSDSLKDANNSTLDSQKDEPQNSVFMLRIIFLLLLICVAVVLMQLMVSIAVTDLRELSHGGKQRRLMKQVECISVLENLFEQRQLSLTMEIPLEEEIKAGSKVFCREMKEIILNKAQSLIETEENKADDGGKKPKTDMNYILKSDLEKGLSEISKSVNTILEHVALQDKKTIDKAVDRILEAMANDRRAGRYNLKKQK